MFSLFNYLKNFESKISESEIPELQFLNLEHYKSETFNVNSFVQIVMSKLEDTNYLINQLKLMIENLKNEIVNQINSNFNNYVILISKLQAIDFKIDNIDKPLQNIKRRILSEINYVEKYEDELKSVLNFINENDNQIRMIALSLQFFKHYNKSKQMIKEIENKYEDNTLISNILNRHPDEHFLNQKSGNYDTLRKYLVDVLRFLSPVQNMYSIYQNFIKTEEQGQMVSEIRQEEIKYMNNVEELLRILINEYFIIDSGSNINLLLMDNLFLLVFKIYFISKNQSLLYSKILDFGLYCDISSIFDNTSLSNARNLPQKIDDLYNLFTNKYKFMYDIFSTLKEEDFIKCCSPTEDFIFQCFVGQLIDKLNSDKFIFNCVDPTVFKDNYKSIVLYLNKSHNFNQIENDSKYTSKTNFLKIKTFIHSFSFFTYFQFIQNEISKVFINLENVNEVLTLNEENFHQNFENDITKNLTSNANLLFNFTKLIKDIFRENKIFLKVIPNLLNFIFQCIKFIIKRQSDLYKSENFQKLINLVTISKSHNNDEVAEEVAANNFSFDEANMLSIKKSLISYLNCLNNFINYFIIADMKKKNNNFVTELTRVAKKEVFMFNSKSEYENFIQKLNFSRTMINDNIIKGLDYYKSGSFIYQMMKCKEIVEELTNKVERE